jgi:hypothetical protein
MKRSRAARLCLALIASAVTTAGLASSAAASGPAPKGKETIELECGGGIGKVTVAIPRPERSHGSGQIVGEKGHGTPVSFTFSATDLRTGEQLFSFSEPAGGKGHAHPHQETTTCTSTTESTAEEFFAGEELPEGVLPQDIIRQTLEVAVIVKR